MTSKEANFSMQLQIRTFGGVDESTGERLVPYSVLTRAAKVTDARYRNAREKLKRQRIVAGDSAAKAEALALGDDEVCTLRYDAAIAEAEAEGRRQELVTLKALLEDQRSQREAATVADRVHARYAP